jgi:hypothetical protein
MQGPFELIVQPHAPASGNGGMTYALPFYDKLEGLRARFPSPETILPMLCGSVGWDVRVEGE